MLMVVEKDEEEAKAFFAISDTHLGLRASWTVHFENKVTSMSLDKLVRFPCRSQ